MSLGQVDAGAFELTYLDREMLEFERLTWKYLGAREAAILERFDMTLTAHTRRVLWLIDQPNALEYDPVNVHRMHRLRDLRRQQRSARASSRASGAL